jgi:hypothetical protein
VNIIPSATSLFGREYSNNFRSFKACRAVTVPSKRLFHTEVGKTHKLYPLRMINRQGFSFPSYLLLALLWAS